MANGALAFKNTEDRRNTILEELRKKGSIRNSDLSELFQCSEVTIRNDLRDMSEAGLLRRIRGGAVSIEERKNTQSILPDKSVSKFVDEKKRIAEKAYEFINQGDAILLDDSTASFYLASYISKHSEKELVVVTNGVRTAYELSDSKHIELHVIGGYVGGQNGGHLPATLGDEAIASIERLHVDKGFIGVHSVNLNVGLTSIATPQMQVKRAIINSSKQLFVLADHSKFDNGYLSIVCPMSNSFTLITDSGVSDDNIRLAASMGLDMLVV